LFQLYFIITNYGKKIAISSKGFLLTDHSEQGEIDDGTGNRPLMMKKRYLLITIIKKNRFLYWL